MYDISAITYSGVEFTVPMCRYTEVLKTAVWKVRDLGFYPFDMSLFVPTIPSQFCGWTFRRLKVVAARYWI
jgi:hypothetical protein